MVQTFHTSFLKHSIFEASEVLEASFHNFNENLKKNNNKILPATGFPLSRPLEIRVPTIWNIIFQVQTWKFLSVRQMTVKSWLMVTEELILETKSVIFLSWSELKKRVLNRLGIHYTCWDPRWTLPPSFVHRSPRRPWPKKNYTYPQKFSKSGINFLVVNILDMMKFITFCFLLWTLVWRSLYYFKNFWI